MQSHIRKKMVKVVSLVGLLAILLGALLPALSLIAPRTATAPTHSQAEVIEISGEDATESADNGTEGENSLETTEQQQEAAE